MDSIDREPGFFLTKGNPIRLGTSATPAALPTYASKIFEVYVTSSSTDASNSVEPFYMNTTMTGAGGVGGRAKFYMTTNVALGGWSNALKAEVVYGATGKTTGLGSAFVAEMTLSDGTTTGNYSPLEVELNVPSGGKTGTKTALGFFSVQGTDVATYRSNGKLFTINGMGTASSATNVFHTTGTVSATHGLRCSIDGVDYDVLLKASTYA